MHVSVGVEDAKFLIADLKQAWGGLWFKIVFKTQGNLPPHKDRI